MGVGEYVRVALVQSDVAIAATPWSSMQLAERSRRVSCELKASGRAISDIPDAFNPTSEPVPGMELGETVVIERYPLIYSDLLEDLFVWTCWRIRLRVEG